MAQAPADSTTKVPWKELGDFLKAADEYQQLIFVCINRREVVLEEIISNIRVVVSTVDAWCKAKSNLVKGLSGRVLRGLRVMATFVDEFEAIDAAQGLGALLDLPYCGMVILSLIHI